MGQWDPSLLWDASVLPLTLRFVIVNASGVDWSDVSVTLTCPDGWQAQGRQPRHWTRPDRYAPGVIGLELGPLPSGRRTVAPFWVRAPEVCEVRHGWSDPGVTFHAVSQPGAGLTLRAPDDAAPTEVAFVAVLHATSAGGRAMRREQTIPVRTEPAG